MTPEPVDQALLDRIGASMRANLRPVRPLPSTGWMVAALLAIFLAVSIAGGVLLGFFGLHKLTPQAIALIFSPLAVVAVLGAMASVHSMIPGSKRLAHPAILMAAGCVADGSDICAAVSRLPHRFVRAPGNYMSQGRTHLGHANCACGMAGAAAGIRGGLACRRGSYRLSGRFRGAHCAGTALPEFPHAAHRGVARRGRSDCGSSGLLGRFEAQGCRVDAIAHSRRMRSRRGIEAAQVRGGDSLSRLCWSCTARISACRTSWCGTVAVVPIAALAGLLLRFEP